MALQSPCRSTGYISFLALSFSLFVYLLSLPTPHSHNFVSSTRAYSIPALSQYLAQHPNPKGLNKHSLSHPGWAFAPPLERTVMVPRCKGLVPNWGSSVGLVTPHPWRPSLLQSPSFWAAEAVIKRQEMIHSRLGISRSNSQQNHHNAKAEEPAGGSGKS